MTNSPIVSRSPLDGFAVVPVVEYEPPTRSTAERHPTAAAPLAAARRVAPVRAAPALPQAIGGRAERDTGHVRADAPSGDVRRRRAAPSAGSHRPPPSGGPATAAAGAQPGRLGAIAGPLGRRTRGRRGAAPDAGATGRRSATRKPRPRSSAPTAAGTESTPSPAGWKRWLPATGLDGRWLPCNRLIEVDDCRRPPGHRVATALELPDGRKHSQRRAGHQGAARARSSRWWPTRANTPASTVRIGESRDANVGSVVYGLEIRDGDAGPQGDAVHPLPHEQHRHRVRAGPPHRVADHALGGLVGGRIWRYELSPADGGTLVRETWDVCKTSRSG